MISGVDLSHYQGAPNFAQVKGSGRDFAVLKATEGTTYVDPMCATNRRNAHAAGMIVGLYHFARGGDPVAQADYFLSVLGALQVGEFVVLDDEDPAINPAWVKAWCDRIAARAGVKPMVYMNQSYRDSQNWASVVADNDALWLARYDGLTTPPASGAWQAAAMKQYTSGGTVAGIPGPVDLDVFYGTRDQLLAYGYSPSTPGDDMPTPDDLFNAPLFTDNPGTPDARTVRLRDFFDELRSEQRSVFDAVFNGGNSMADGNKSISQSLAEIHAGLPAAQDPKVLAQEIVALIGQLPAPAAAEVAKLVLAGLNGASLNVSTPTA